MTDQKADKLSHQQYVSLFNQMATMPTMHQNRKRGGMAGELTQLHRKCGVCAAAITQHNAHYVELYLDARALLLIVFVCHSCKSLHPLIMERGEGERPVYSIVENREAERIWARFYTMVANGPKKLPWWDLWGRIEGALRQLKLILSRAQ